jgi:GxxExxY protein
MIEPNPQLDELARAVNGAAIEVHRVLGAGFLESVYEQALAIEFGLRQIPFQRQHPIALKYKGQMVGEARLDFLVGDQLIVELKAVDTIHPIHHAQVLNYLKATGLQLGLLLNFNVELMRDGIKRIVLT